MYRRLLPCTKIKRGAAAVAVAIVAAAIAVAAFTLKTKRSFYAALMEIKSYPHFLFDWSLKMMEFFNQYTFSAETRN